MSVEPVVVTQSQDQGGCLKCHRDVDYEQVWEEDIHYVIACIPRPCLL